MLKNEVDRVPDMGFVWPAMPKPIFFEAFFLWVYGYGV